MIAALGLIGVAIWLVPGEKRRLVMMSVIEAWRSWEVKSRPARMFRLPGLGWRAFDVRVDRGVVCDG